jgi:glucose-1-phosphate thymidylyltransferase
MPTVIWVKQVDQPEAFGVVKLNEANEIVELVENQKHLFQIWLSLGFIILRMAVLKTNCS